MPLISQASKLERLLMFCCHNFTPKTSSLNMSFSQTISNVYPQIFGLLSAMLTLCYEIPSFDAMNARLIAEGKRNRWLFANPQKLGSHLMKNAQELYQKVACDRSVIKNSILAKLIKTLLPFWDKKVNFFFRFLGMNII